MNFLKNIFFGLLLLNTSLSAQSILPNDSADVQQIQNFEFLSGSIVLTSKATLIPNGAYFTNGLMKFEKTLGYPFRTFTMSYEYTTKENMDTALVRLVFKNSADSCIGQLDVPVFESEDFINVSIDNPSLYNAAKFDVYVYSTGSPWIRDNSVLTIQSMVASNQVYDNTNYTLSPNPASTTSQLNSIDASNIRAVKVTNTSGLVLIDVPSVNASQYNINVSTLTAGNYSVLIYSDNGVFSKQMIIQ